MTLDVHTLVVILGLSHLLQVVVLSFHYRIGRTYRGLGWWLLWSSSNTGAVFLLLVRAVPAWRVAAILAQNPLFVLGASALYIGLMRFHGRRENRPVLAAVVLAFFVAHAALLLVVDDISARGVVISATIAVISLLNARDLFAARSGATSAPAAQLSLVLLAQGLFFLGRATYMVARPTGGDIFSSSTLNVLPFLDAFVVSNLLTFGLIVLINRRLHAEMSEARDHFALLFETIPDAVLITRLDDGICLRVNQGFESLTGYRREEILGRSTAALEMYADPGDRERVVAALRGEGSIASFECAFRRKDGGPFTGSMSARVVRFGGEPHVISVTRDVSDRKRAEQALVRHASEIRELNLGLERRVADRTRELAETNRELEALVYSIAHDLRAPLRAIDGFSGILAEDHLARLDPEGLRLFGRIRAGAQAMDRLIRDLLDYAHACAAELHRGPVDMAALACAVFAREASESDRQAVQFAIGELPEAIGDVALLRRALGHLLANALKYTARRAERRIELAGEREGEWVTYRVSDNGIGFDPSHAGKLFGLFQRLHPGEEFEGAGIGLAIVQRIVERHGGRVAAEARVNEGATFTFTLPAGESRRG